MLSLSRGYLPSAFTQLNPMLFTQELISYAKLKKC